MKTIAIDFDGVIHKYSEGWKDGTIYDDSFDGVFDIIKDLMKDNSVFIFSSRSPRQIKKWLKEYLYYATDMPFDEWLFGYSVGIIPFWKKFWTKRNVLGITKRKLPAYVYVDDRALKFEGDWNETLTKLKEIL